MADRGFVLRCVYAACLFGATCNHALILARHGLFWDYGGVSWPSAAFWTGLTFADPLAILLLFARPRLGVGVTMAIIVADVAHNLWIKSVYAPDGDLIRFVAADLFMLSQIGFLLFVCASARFAWPPSRPDQRVGTGSGPE